MVHHIQRDGQLFAIIIPHDFEAPGLHFVTTDDMTQQMAYMRHPAGRVIEPHRHNHAPRTVARTIEALFVRNGKLRVDIYDDDGNYFESHVLVGGDAILLVGGGHGFEMIEETHMIEVKQGPYPGHMDKTRFPAVSNERIHISD